MGSIVKKLRVYFRKIIPPHPLQKLTIYKFWTIRNNSLIKLIKYKIIKVDLKSLINSK